MPGLPNSTGVSQEMENMFSVFKQATNSKVEQIFKRKLYKQVKKVEKLKETPDLDIPVAHLTNDNIPEIVNGIPGDPIEARPFDEHFSGAKLGSSWMVIGFILFTHQALHHKKVRHNLGE